MSLFKDACLGYLCYSGLGFRSSETIEFSRTHDTPFITRIAMNNRGRVGSSTHADHFHFVRLAASTKRPPLLGSNKPPATLIRFIPQL